MKYCLGIDTSNYTTSVALCDMNGKIEVNEKLILDVSEGKRGLRQSDAVFSHIKNLPAVFEKIGKRDIAAVGYSAYPRDVEGSYMPCFLAGKNAACALSGILGIPLYAFSHQRGHIRAALYSADAQHLLGGEYIAFHISGGTTEVLLVKNGEISIIGGTKDISCGQAVDRVGVMLGLKFPCGAELERLITKEDDSKPKICVDGYYANLSGLENIGAKMINEGAGKNEVAAFTINFIKRTLEAITDNIKCDHPTLPLLFSGGVMSNGIIREAFTNKYGAYFAEPAFSSDNAAGIALLTYDKERLK